LTVVSSVAAIASHALSSASGANASAWCAILRASDHVKAELKEKLGRLVA